MPEKKVFFNCSIVVDGTELRDRARRVTVNESADELDTTAFGGSGYHEAEPGLKAGEVTTEFFQGFDANGTHDVLYPLFQGNEEFILRIGPEGGDGSATNPVWVGPVKIYNYNFIDAEVGQATTNTVTFRLTSAPHIDET